MRLLKQTKLDIVSNVAKAALTQRVEDFNNSVDVYINHVLDVLIGEENTSKMLRLPSIYFPLVSSVAVYFEVKDSDDNRRPRTVELDKLIITDEGYQRWSNNGTMLKDRIVPNCYRNGCTLYPEEDTEHKALVQAGNALAKVRSEIVSDLDSLRSTVTTALAGINTDKKLAEVYPELLQHVPKGASATKGLAITNDEISAAIECAASEEIPCE